MIQGRAALMAVVLCAAGAAAADDQTAVGAGAVQQPWLAEITVVTDQKPASFVVEVLPEWAPLGAERFADMVRRRGWSWCWCWCCWCCCSCCCSWSCWWSCC